MFRLTINNNNPDDNFRKLDADSETTSDGIENKNAQVLGDRVLSGFLGDSGGGILNLATYSYNDLNGNGNANVH